MGLAGKKIGIALTGSHCTIPTIWPALEALKEQGAELYPIVSAAVAQTDTRFGRAADVLARLTGICGRAPWADLASVEGIGPGCLLDLLAVVPCTGNTLAKLANGISDTPVTLACKAHLRNQRPVVLSVSTNDGLSGNAVNIGLLLGRKHYYFVPFGQDAPHIKASSLVAKVELLTATIEAALAGRQIEPLLDTG